MKNMKNYLLLIISFVFLFLSYCSKDNTSVDSNPPSPAITDTGDPLGQADEVTIGSEGGIANSSDGLLSVNIPQGALSGSTIISIQPITNNAPLGIGKGYRLEPEGLSFEKPVTLTFHYNDELLDSKPAEFLWIVFQESDGSWKAMLKSTVDTNAKTVTVETSHFSDWSLGRFVDLTLQPLEKTIKKGGKIAFAIAGFDKGDSYYGGHPPLSEEVLAPVIPVSEKANDVLSPLVPEIYISTSDELSFMPVEWTLNGVKSPISNDFGSLQSSGYKATYTAPSTVPKHNTVAVSVKLKTSTELGASTTFLLTSNITIVENDLFLQVEFLGNTYTYYQYGYDLSETPDSSSFSIVLCGLSENMLHIGGSTYNDMGISDGIEIYFENPVSNGSRGLIGIGDGGNDALDFAIFNPARSYDMENVTRTRLQDNSCYFERNASNNITMTLTKFEGSVNTDVEGSFSGTLYYADPNDDLDCKSSTPYPVSGSFHLILTDFGK